MLQKLKIFLPIFLLTICSCRVSNSSKNNGQKAFSDFEVVCNNQITWNDLLSQEENHYFVFIYSETCAHCHDIQDEIVGYANEDITKTYFIDSKNSGHVPVVKDIESTIGATEISDVGILGTPTLFEILHYAVYANVAGKDNILSFLFDEHPL